ncbi:MAG: Crm2 family CRISPR-associated protein [bacterium]|nr:MAG: Crm2 family CRISPR-associated protein [bacterium]
MSYLLIIHIGPVQDFIASARRSRDLWFGSWLLSELSKAAANSIVQQEGKLTNLIFPATKTDDDLKPNSSFDVANKIVAIIENPPKTIAEKVLSDITQRLEQIKNLAFKNIAGPFDSDVANLQIEDMLEIFWVAKKLDKDYAQVREETEALMTARKATNNYKKVPWEQRNGVKSSLDGQRESVIDKTVYEQFDEKKMWRKYHIRRGEHLCGVGLLKRHGERGAGENRFFSTSHVASLPFLSLFTEATKAIAKPAFKEYINTLKSLDVASEELGNVPGDMHPIFENYDGELLYEERLGDFFAKNETAKVKQAEEALRKFYQDCEPIIDNKKPSAYYGLLQADGDAMGKAIAQQKNVEGHQAISKALSAFAKGARQIVKENNGSLVYAGGDDVLAFLPLHTILKCAQQLAKDFHEKLKLEMFPVESNISPTLSVGIAIVHHLDPLSDALALVRKAEKAAKSLVNKKALAIIVSKRSGIDTTIKGHWDALDKRLDYWVKLLQQRKIPHGVAYELRNLALRFSSKDPSEQESFIPILQIEAARILARKRVKYGQEAIDKEVMAYVKELLGSPDKKQTVTVEDLANELIVARVFADALKLTKLISNKEDKS